jgi:hypothetical protein
MNQLAKRIVDLSTGDVADTPPRPLSKRAKGGEARARKLSARKRTTIARKAARTRWKAT